MRRSLVTRARSQTAFWEPVFYMANISWQIKYGTRIDYILPLLWVVSSVFSWNLNVTWAGLMVKIFPPISFVQYNLNTTKQLVKSSRLCHLWQRHFVRCIVGRFGGTCSLTHYGTMASKLYFWRIFYCILWIYTIYPEEGGSFCNRNTRLSWIF